jgi:hypothetical protein
VYLCAVELLLNSWLLPVYVYAYAEYNVLLMQQLLPKFTAYEEESHFILNCSFGGLFVIHFPCYCILLFLMYVNRKFFELRFVSSFTFLLFHVTISVRKI